MNNNKVEYLLSKYHECVREINKGCIKLGREMYSLGESLEYANQWFHRPHNNRIGVLFHDSIADVNKWISVPIEVFVKGNFKDFAKRYCKYE